MDEKEKNEVEMARTERVTLMEASLLKQLERLATPTKRSTRTRGGVRPGRTEIAPRTDEKSPAAVGGIDVENIPLERFLTRLLFSDEGRNLHLLIDSSQSMKFNGFTDAPLVSKFDLARKIAAALGYIALARRGSARVFAFDTIRRRHNPPLHDKARIPDLLAQLEGMRGGGVLNFAHSLDNYMRRTQSSGVYLVLSDFFDSGWSEAIGALVKRGRRIVLLQVIERSGIESNLLKDLRFLETVESNPDPVTITPPILEAYREALRERDKRWTMISERYGMTYLRVTTDVPFESVLLRALHEVGLLPE